jgi:hypothetical protein
VWGDREERKAIRTYLRIVWQENNKGSIVKVVSDRVGVQNERDSILKVSLKCIDSHSNIYCLLQWWWSNRWSETPPDITNLEFGRWLLQQYKDANKIELPNNKKMA